MAASRPARRIGAFTAVIEQTGTLPRLEGLA
jgi:hypothetical protein